MPWFMVGAKLLLSARQDGRQIRAKITIITDIHAAPQNFFRIFAIADGKGLSAAMLWKKGLSDK